MTNIDGGTTTGGRSEATRHIASGRMAKAAWFGREFWNPSGAGVVAVRFKRN